mgnify:CR=1 FL=1
MSDKRRILFVVYDHFALLDMAGPATAFAMADRWAGGGVYDVHTLSPRGGLIQSSGGPPVQTESLNKYRPGKRDTILVMGAEKRPAVDASSDPHLIKWLKSAEKNAERYGSVCSGCFILATAGLLENKRATTHWEACRALQHYCPQAEILADALYVVDDRLWTSAGMTTGVDMALAIIERDLGSAIMGAVAKRLVVYAHRSGGQTQFSDVLNAQIAAGDAFYELIEWAKKHVAEGLKVEDLASRARMSERTFYRKFTEQVGITPAKYLDAIRLEKAKELLEANVAVKVVAAKVGFRSEVGFRNAFKAKFKISPALHARMHGAKVA